MTATSAATAGATSHWKPRTTRFLPARPSIEPGDKLRFGASAFASPAGAKPAVLEWRVGRVGQRGSYELDELWRKEVNSGRSLDIPPDVFKAPGEYRVRARWRDAGGRCGHWSPPVAVNVK